MDSHGRDDSVMNAQWASKDSMVLETGCVALRERQAVRVAAKTLMNEYMLSRSFRVGGNWGLGAFARSASTLRMCILAL